MDDHPKRLIPLQDIAERFDLNLQELIKIDKVFPVRITEYVYSLIKEKNDAIYKQFIPDIRELENNDSTTLDPLSEDRDSPVKSIVHRYPNRCLFLVSPTCTNYCRFCTRKRRVGDDSKISYSYVEDGLQYIREHSEIRDVIISGGDPLLLSISQLEHILSSLRSIPHVEIIRIGSRVPCVAPYLITRGLATMISQYHPVYMNIHFNHPSEITKDVEMALTKLANAGIPLGSQTVLLKDVNDDPTVMRELMHKLLMNRVKPYYIYQADLVEGTNHFITTVQTGVDIIDNLRGWTSGLGVPHYVIDSPDGGGKIPMLPDYFINNENGKIIMRNYKYDICEYTEPI